MENIQKTNVETSAYNKLNFYLRQIRSKTDFIPETAIVLGSGLGNFSDKVKKVCILILKTSLLALTKCMRDVLFSDILKVNL